MPNLNGYVLTNINRGSPPKNYGMIKMTKNELNENQLLWLSMSLTAECPHCGEMVTVGPENTYYRLGVTVRDDAGNITKSTPGGFMTDCPHCAQRIGINFFAELTKGGKNE